MDGPRIVQQEWAIRIRPNHKEACQTAQQVTSFPPALRVACGVNCTVVETKSGALWGAGKNQDGQLGAADTEDVALPQRIPQSEPLEYPLRSLGAGDGFLVVVDGGGATYLSGRRLFSQTGWPGDGSLSQMGGLPPMKRVFAGGQHCLGLSEDGLTWGWGDNEHHQLTEAAGVPHSGPCLMVLPGCMAIVDVRAGRNSSFAVTADGKIFAVGYNGCGGLGLRDRARRSDWCHQPVAVVKNSRAKSARSAVLEDAHQPEDIGIADVQSVWGTLKAQLESGPAYSDLSRYPLLGDEESEALRCQFMEGLVTGSSPVGDWKRESAGLADWRRKEAAAVDVVRAELATVQQRVAELDLERANAKKSRTRGTQRALAVCRAEEDSAKDAVRRLEKALHRTSGLEQRLKLAAAGQEEVKTKLQRKIEPVCPKVFTPEDLALVLNFSGVPQAIPLLEKWPLDSEKLKFVGNGALKELGVAGRVARKRVIHGLRCLVRGEFFSHKLSCPMCQATTVEQTVAKLEEEGLQLAVDVLASQELTMGPLLYMSVGDLKAVFDMEIMEASIVKQQLKTMKHVHLGIKSI